MSVMDVILEDEDSQSQESVLVPPQNFRIVEDNSIYRSAFPEPSNFPFLQSLNLKSIICMCTEPYPEEHLKFLNANKIKLFQFGIDGTKTAPIPNSTITEALKIIIDVRNHPLLIHCKRGKHRTGCLVGCFRKLQNWCLSSVLEEYNQCVGAKSRSGDLKFMEMFDVSLLRYSLQTLIYQYQGYGSKKRRLLYKEEEFMQKSSRRSSLV